MALSVNTNVAAMIAQINLGQSTDRLNVSLERLSTGLKINRAVDDAAGLVVSEYQRAQIAGLEQAVTNVDRASSFAQTAEAALGEINSVLVDLRQLAIDAANTGSHDRNGLEAIQSEVDNLLESVDRIAGKSKFGNKTILDGTMGINGFSNNPDIEFLQAGDLEVLTFDANADGIQDANPSWVYTITITQQASKTTLTSQMGTNLTSEENLLINGVVINLTTGMTQGDVVETINQFSGQTGFEASLSTTGTEITLEALEYGDIDLDIYSDRQTNVGATGFGVAGTPAVGVDVDGTIERNAGPVGAVTTNNTDASGQGSVLTGEFDHDGSRISVETEKLSENPAGSTLATLILSNQSPRFHVGAFADDSTNVTIQRSSADSLGIGVGEIYASLAKIDVRSPDGAGDAISVIDRAIVEVASQRGSIGAFQSQNLAKTRNNLESQFSNMSAAESVLRDTDFATEITNFTNEQIRQQAATTVLGLANQTAQQVLALLAG